MQPYTVQNTFLGPCTYEVIPITPPFKPNKSITWHLLNFSNDEINRLAKEVDVDKLKQDLLYGFTVYRGKAFLFDNLTNFYLILLLNTRLYQ